MSTRVRENKMEVIDFSQRKNQRSVLSDMQYRYVFNPGVEIFMPGLYGGKALSIVTIKHGEFNLLQPIPYIIRDESDAAMLVENRESPRNDIADMIGKAEHIKTPFAQALQIMESYAENGVRILNSITGVTPDIAVGIEQTLMPVIFDTIIDLQADLVEHGRERLRDASLPPHLIKMASDVLDEMLESCSFAVNYMQGYLDVSKSEITNRRVPGGKGKPFWDDYDDRLAHQLHRSRPTEAELAVEAQKVAANTGKDIAAAILEAAKLVQATPSVPNISAEQMAAFTANMEKLERWNALLSSKPELAALLEPTPVAVPTLDYLQPIENVDETETVEEVVSKRGKKNRG